MININQFDVFIKCKSTLKVCSKSDDGVFMTDSILEAINFDKVKTNYANSLSKSEESYKSVDCLFDYSNTNHNFIEFKNGNLKNGSEKKDIKQKLTDSLYIFQNITKTDNSYTRKYTDFILVYNEQKNPLPNQYLKKHISIKAKQDIVLFGMEGFKRKDVNNVHTYTKKEFENYLLSFAGSLNV